MKQTDLLIVNFAATCVRIFAVIIIGFFMTRILVNQLGLELFGLFTTIGASGMLLTMFTNILQLSVARELGICVGKNDDKELRVAFSSSFYIQLVGAIAICIFGVLFSGLITKGLTIPEGYEWQTWFCLILTFVQFAIGVLASPFGGLIRAHQHLRTITVLQLGVKISIFLCALWMIVWEGDKLVFFVVANLVTFTIFQLIHVWIALKRYPESYPKISDFSMDATKSIFKYASLALMGGIGGQIRRNGIAVILNVYFGNIVTAANGIAIRLSNLIALFVGTISPVIQPAMNANQGAGNNSFITKLIPMSSTIGLAIIIPVAMPLLFETESLLMFWLNTELPEYAVLFSQLVVSTFVVTMISKGHGMALHAQGNIGMLTLVNQGLIILFIFGAAFVAVQLDDIPWLLPAGELIGLVLATSFWQPFWVAKKMNFSNRIWFRYTVFPAVLYVISNLLMYWGVSQFLEAGMLRAVVLGFLSGCICFTILWNFGFENAERKSLIGFANKSYRKLWSVFKQTANINHLF